MKMDRNQVIGFVLLALLLFTYLYISTKNSQELQMKKQREEDSVALVKRRADSIAALNASKDTTHKANISINDTGHSVQAQTEALTVIENNVLRITFSNKGGQPKKVELKHYKSYDSSLVVLGG